MTQIPWAPGARFFRIVCALGQPIPDTVDDPDADPDLVTMGGQVEITLDARRARYLDAAGKWRMLTLGPVRYQIDPATGELVDGQGRVGSFLLDSSSAGIETPDGTPHPGWTYRAAVSPAVGEPWTVTFPSTAPAGGVVDLVDVADVPAVAPSPSVAAPTPPPLAAAGSGLWTSAAQFFTVTCALGQPIPDRPDDPDADPDLVTIGGTVTITMGVRRAKYLDSAGLWRMLNLPAQTFTIDPASGQLVDGEGRVGARLLDTTSAGIIPAGFTYTAAVTPAVGEPWSHTFPGQAPPGGVLDLVAAAPVAPSAGVTPELAQRVTIAEGLLAALRQDVDEWDDTAHVHYQQTPAATWTIPNPHGRPCTLTLLNPAGEIIDTDTVISSTQVILTFPAPYAGTAILT